MNPIKRVWAEAKRFTGKHCNYTPPQLEQTVEPAFDSIDVQLIRKYLRKAREYMNTCTYREGHSAGPELLQAVKKYKSHQRVPANK